tara:strand:- start:440 stop:631 length:192 start_codon:yes stop_codon:yes gene_type:complete
MDITFDNKRFLLIRDVNENDTQLKFRMDYIINEYKRNNNIDLNNIIQKSKIERNKQFLKCNYN